MSMNEKLREEREFDCETAIGSQKLSTFPATVVFFAFSPSGEKAKKGKARDNAGAAEQAKPARRGKPRKGGIK